MQAYNPKDFECDTHRLISEKYDRLIWAIAHKISGDRATASLEDNYADLWLGVFEAIEGFTKQNNYSNGPIETWVDTKPFDKYLKTCLWNKKNHKGKQIANKYEIHRDTVPTHLEEVLNVSAADDPVYSDVFGHVGVDLSDRERNLVHSILIDPNKYLTEDGKVKVSPLERSLGWSRRETEEVLDTIKKKMELGCNTGI